MFRWGYLIPRLIATVLLAFLLLVCIDPLAQWALTAAGQSTLGVKVDVGQVHTSPFLLEATINDVQVTNPADPDTNLVEFDLAWLDIDGESLARRQLLVRNAAISGLVIGAERVESGQLENRDKPDDTTDSAFADATLEWLESTAKLLEGDIESDLETPPLAREMGNRWPAEYEQLEARVEAWLVRSRALKSLPDQLKQGDWLAQATQVRDASLEVQSLRTELADIRGELSRLRMQVQADRVNLQAAAQRDREKIRQRIQLKDVDRQALTDYLLGPELGPRLRQISGWIKSTREAIPTAPTVKEAERGRGTNVPFAFYDPRPDLLIERIRLDGAVYHNQKFYNFAGEGHDFTTQPKQHGKPALVRLKFDQPAETWVELSIDRTGEIPADRLTLLCPSFPQDKQTWGNAQTLALKVPPGDLALQLVMTLQGEQLTGRARVQRSNVQISSVVADSLGGERVGRRIDTALATTRKIDVLVHLTGTLADPAWQIESEIGQQLATGLKTAVATELAHQREKIQQKVDAKLNEQIAAISDKIAAEQQKVIDKLGIADLQQGQFQALLPRVGGDNAAGSRSGGEIGRDLIRGILNR